MPIAAVRALRLSLPKADLAAAARLGLPVWHLGMVAAPPLL